MTGWVLLLFSLSEWVIRLLMIPVILRRRLKPAVSLSWLVVILALPVVGLFFYLLIGVPYLGTQRRKIYRRVMQRDTPERRRQQVYQRSQRPVFEGPLRNLIRQAEQVTGNPIVGDNHADLIDDTQAFLDQLVEDINAARHHVHLLYYIFVNDDTGMRVCNALIKAAERGVECRLLVDASGSKKLLKSSVPKRLRKHGVEIHDMLPVAPWRRQLARIDLRNHRKLTVIDGEVAYTGSHNLVNADYHRADYDGDWIDLSSRMRGPIVSQFQAVFLDDWRFTTGRELDGEAYFPTVEPAGDTLMQAVPTGPSYGADTFRRVMLAALNCAEKRIVMTTPYLVPDESTLLALTMAADRGVQVIIITPAKGDHRLVNLAAASHYETLMESGVDIYRYHGGLLHAKTAVIDDAFALLGSANLDIRSFDLNFELNVLLYGEKIAKKLEKTQREYLDKSELLDAEQWNQRPTMRRYAENAAALFSPLL